MRAEKPIIKRGEHLLTKSDTEQALEHAEAFIRLALCIDQKSFSVAARDWLEKYGSDPIEIAEDSRYDNNVDFDKLEKEAGLRL